MTQITIEIGPIETVREKRAFGLPDATYHRVRASATYKAPKVEVENPSEEPIKLTTRASKRKFELEERLPDLAFKDPRAPTKEHWRTIVASQMATKLAFAILSGLEE